MYNENDENKRRILQLVTIGAVAIVLVGVVVLGMVTGHWPWEKEDQSGDYTGMPSQSAQDTTLPEASSEETLPEDVTTQATVPGGTTAKPTEGENSGGGNDSLDFDSLKPSTAPTESATKPTEKPTEPATKPTEKPTEPPTQPTTKPSTGESEIEIPLN